MDTLTLIAFTTAVLIVVGGITALSFAWRQRKPRKRLRKQFGKEYDRTVDDVGNETRAEPELAGRVRHARSLNLIPLTGEQTAQYLIEWEALEEELQQDPIAAAQETEQLIRRAMHAKGYPVEYHDQLIEDMSVGYPDHVTNYQALHDLVARSKTETVAVEEMRNAARACKALVEEILDIELVEKSYQNTP